MMSYSIVATKFKKILHWCCEGHEPWSIISSSFWPSWWFWWQKEKAILSMDIKNQNLITIFQVDCHCDIVDIYQKWLSPYSSFSKFILEWVVRATKCFCIICHQLIMRDVNEGRTCFLHLVDQLSVSTSGG